jgi:hypothetical protein
MPLLTLRPTSTGAQAAVTGTSGGANAHLDLSDDNDNTVTRGTADVAYTYLGLGDVSLSAGQRIKRVKTRLRYGRDANDVGGLETCRVRLDYNGTKSTGDNYKSASPTVVTADGAWQLTAPGGVAWTQAIVNGMSAEITWYLTDSPAGNFFLRVSELYVIAESNSQPTITVPTVTGATVTTNPSWSFAYSDADGDAQSATRVKVFSSAQYTASGFDPETSVATWDSGQLNGAVVSGTVGAGLVPGVTYKLYAKAAQAWSGPQGTLWWSAWQPSAAFSVVLVAPPAPVMSVTGFTDIPGYRAVCSADAPVNLLSTQEAGFESTGVGTWVKVSTGANPTLARSTARSHSGAASMSLTSASTGTATAVLSGVGYAVLNGRTYTARASFRAAATGRTVRVDISWYNIAGALLSTSSGSTTTDNSSGWVDASVTATAPATATSATVSVNVLSTAISEVHYVDDISLHEGTVTSWTPGGYRPSEAVIVERCDRVSADRGLPGNWVRPQVGSGGTTLRSTAGFALNSAAKDMVVWEPLTVSLAGAAGCIHWSQRSGSGVTTGGFNAGFTAGFGASSSDIAAKLYAGAHPDPGQVLDWVFPVAPSRSHTVSAYLWRGSTAVTVQLYIDWLDETGATVVSTGGAGSNLALTTTPTRYATSATAPAGARYARAVVLNVNGATTTEVFVTSVGFGLTTGSTDDPPAGIAPVWRTVRELSGTNAPPVGELAVRADHEIPPGRPVAYRAHLEVLAPDGTALVSAQSNLVPMYLDPPARTMLVDPYAPENGMPVGIDVNWTETRSRSQQAFQPRGRSADDQLDADPVVSRDWLGGQDAAYTIFVHSDSDLRRLRALTGSWRPVLLQFKAGGQRFLMLVDDETTTSMTRSHYAVAVKGLSVARP